MTDELRNVAVHEAGHVVIAWALGIRCRSVTIRADLNSAGHAMFPDFEEIEERWGRLGRRHAGSSAVIARILAQMAGSAAERMVYGTSEGDAADRREVLWITFDFYGGDTERRISAELRLWRSAEHLVRRHRDRIERLADALVARRRLGARQIEAVLK